MKKAAAALAAGILLAPLIVVVPFAAVAGNAAAACPTAEAQGVDSAAVEAAVKLILGGGSGPTVPVEGLDLPTTQIPMAKAIVATGIALQVPARGQVIALATAMQESRLRNLTYGDRDSLGLFQQRPSQGWGTPEQVTDPVYASTSFYKALLAVPGWQELPLTVAAQKVQLSGFPDAYAQWEPLATALQQAIGASLGAPAAGTAPTAAASPGTCTPPGADTDWGVIPPGTLPAGYQVPSDAPLPVQSAIRWALGQLNTPYQWGGSCTNSHGEDPMGRCDCSSLVMQAYRAAGVNTLDRVTYDQVKQGTAVQPSDLRPGDLLFTEPGPNGPEHVGMYIGSGLVVNAPHTGDVVRIAQWDSWKSGVIAIRRIVP
ncbi:C40 family peptidase [Kitasatospora phosalacinea]|uniref:Lipoprotein n=1 Tax=Kitasatospora phosalacinea TaxID=2065 RepID=A0A9W6PKV8_9ACTN|nr:C40 family peptidase [Kitasatospora phosalacinea]GLW58160.1 lipoprotein [Kitasatospora phosalacinea]